MLGAARWSMVLDLGEHYDYYEKQAQKKAFREKVEEWNKQVEESKKSFAARWKEAVEKGGNFSGDDADELAKDLIKLGLSELIEIKR